MTQLLDSIRSWLLILPLVLAAPSTRNLITYQTLSLYSPLDSLPDYSYAGAFYSNRPLPATNTVPTVSIASTNDRTDRTEDIQNAVTSLSKIGGGIVELSSGPFHLTKQTIRIYGSGITIRGSFATDDLTTIHASGDPRYIFTIGDPNFAGPTVDEKASSAISDDYVAVGADTLQVENAALFKIGQQVQIKKILTQQWIDAMGMGELYRDGRHQTWIAPGSASIQPRQIVAIDTTSNLVTLDVPLTDSINASFHSAGSITAFTFPKPPASRNSIENLRVQLDKDQSNVAIDDDSMFPGVLIFSSWSEDNWVRNVNATGFATYFTTEKDSRRVTFQNVNMNRTKPTDNSAGVPADIMIRGGTALVLRCSTMGVPKSNSWNVATGSLVAGPVSVVEYTSTNPEHVIQPHMRWQTGFLLDNSNVGGADLINRGIMGSGHGIRQACSGTSKLLAK